MENSKFIIVKEKNYLKKEEIFAEFIFAILTLYQSIIDLSQKFIL